jgi:hypothetical protein
VDLDTGSFSTRNLTPGTYGVRLHAGNGTYRCQDLVVPPQGLEGVVQEDWPVIAADLKSTSANLSAASARVDGWLERNEENVDRLLGEGLDEVTGLVSDMRQAAEQLNRLSSRLREDPSRLIYRPAQDPVVVEP